jgi:hypothetical protein
MNGARSNISLEPRLHRLQYRATIGVFTQTQHLEKHCLLECTEYTCHDYIVVM